MILKNIDILNSNFTISFDNKGEHVINVVSIILECQKGRFVSVQRIYVQYIRRQEIINYIKNMVFQHLLLNPDDIFDWNKCIDYAWPKEYCIE